MSILSKLATFPSKPRIFILTDMLNEPDDSQSLVRYLLYANEFETRGICATTSTWLRSSTHPEEIRRIITAYGKVVKNLNSHVNPDFQYQTADELLKLVTSGPAVYGKNALRDSEPLSKGALRLLSALQESSEPLYVPVWGGVNTLAQALRYLAQTSSSREAAIERAKLRVYTISDQDNSGPWVRAKYPDVFYVVSAHGWNQYGQGSWLGMNGGAGDGPDPTKVLNPWLKEHIQVGDFGAEAYPPVKFGMEGDTPSFLWLVQNGLNHRDRIDWGGWGGRYTRPQAEADWEDGIDVNHFYNASDFGVLGADEKRYSDHKTTIWRWRDAVQDDFAARMQWTLTDHFAEAGHPPIVDINSHVGVDSLILQVKPGETHILDASGTYDPDHAHAETGLDYVWMLYGDVNGFHFFGKGPKVKIEAIDDDPVSQQLDDNSAGFSSHIRGHKVQVLVPPMERNPQTGLVTPDFHVVLQVTNSAGPYPIRRYKRVVFSYVDDGSPVPLGKIPDGFE
ncbi:hypothetical protein N7481_012946 [Penicillium waksmanii]|uniref:uncharacterized protein n=1 Tax=Penicillium waksmanii TaxID=69791 RepID=UPI0025467993|nr:uncharacterized protein N7481_012946 [Penicillium waksmanii]KAJ5966232.1 hypothetical protein N7481_012946 [Penicillium waksmanii]